MANNRYRLSEPVDRGYAWFDIADTQAETPNTPVAIFFRDLPNARLIAHSLTTILNAVDEKKYHAPKDETESSNPQGS